MTLTDSQQRMLNYLAAKDAGEHRVTCPVRNQNYAQVRGALVAKGLVVAEVEHGGRILTDAGRELAVPQAPPAHLVDRDERTSAPVERPRVCPAGFRHEASFMYAMSSGTLGTFRDELGCRGTCRCGLEVVRFTAEGRTPASNRRAWLPAAELELGEVHGPATRQAAELAERFPIGARARNVNTGLRFWIIGHEIARDGEEIISVDYRDGSPPASGAAATAVLDTEPAEQTSELERLDTADPAAGDYLGEIEPAAEVPTSYGHALRMIDELRRRVAELEAAARPADELDPVRAALVDLDELPATLVLDPDVTADELEPAAASEMSCLECGSDTIPPTPGRPEERGHYCDKCGSCWNKDGSRRL